MNTLGFLGPWRLARHCCVIDINGICVVNVSDVAPKHARLIAVAPELHEALRDARKWLPMHKHMRAAVDLMERIDAVLAKVAGHD